MLSRAYEISEKREELKEMAYACARKFNRSRSEWAFEQMLRICLASAIFRHPQERCEKFAELCGRLLEEDYIEAERALNDLMAMAETMVVMEKFLSKFESLEKIGTEGSSKRGYSQESKDFLAISRLVACCVSMDYI